MELSPEDRQRIYDEEKAKLDAEDAARAEVRAQLQAERGEVGGLPPADPAPPAVAPTPVRSGGGPGLLGLLLVLGIVAYATQGTWLPLVQPDPRLQGHKPDDIVAEDVDRKYTATEWIETHPDVPIDQATLFIVKKNAARLAELEAYVTLTEYNNIDVGHTYAQVVAYWGRPGTQTAKSQIAGITTEAYQWTNPDPGGTIILMFQNGRLVQKNQSGLSD